MTTYKITPEREPHRAMEYFRTAGFACRERDMDAYG